MPPNWRPRGEPLGKVMEAKGWTGGLRTTATGLVAKWGSGKDEGDLRG